jgi:uncharacterized protein (TIGR04255 family)
MTTQHLPIKLLKDPLIDAIFEIRFSSSTEISNVLPGFFFAKFEKKELRVEQLQTAQIPVQIRNMDSNLRYQPLMRMHWGTFIIFIGDAMLGIGCKMPYPGWNTFRERIREVVAVLFEAGIINTIERYSMKYINIIEGESLSDQIQKTNIELRVGDHVVRKEKFSVRIEIANSDFINIIQLAAPVSAVLPNKEVRNGIIVDIDCIGTRQHININDFNKDLPNLLESVHSECKVKFFECLKPETITTLEPVYA